jgi:hypothetical protein
MIQHQEYAREAYDDLAPGKRILSLQYQPEAELHAALAALVLRKERELVQSLENEHTPIAGIDYASLTTLWRKYNVLSWPERECEHLRRVIRAALDEYATAFGLTERPGFVQCWANVLRPGQEFGLHGHGTDQVSGVYYPDAGASTEDSGATYYMLSEPDARGEGDFLEIVPRTGMVNVFQADIQHYVSTYQGPSPRISIAWDIVHDPAGHANLLPL